MEQEEEHMRVGSTSARQASRTAISAHQVYQKAAADKTIEQRVSEMGDRAPGKRQKASRDRRTERSNELKCTHTTDLQTTHPRLNNHPQHASKNLGESE